MVRAALLPLLTLAAADLPVARDRLVRRVLGAGAAGSLPHATVLEA